MRLLESIYQNRALLLERYLAEFKNSLKVEPYFGIEIEFYLLKQDHSVVEGQKQIENYILEITNALNRFSFFQKIEKEQGNGQIEIKTKKTSNLINLAKEIEEIKSLANDSASNHNLDISFLSQPFIDDCGSALQLNLSLYSLSSKLEVSNNNLYSKSNNEISDLQYHSIAGIFKLLNHMMVFLAPDPTDYLRFNKITNHNLFAKGKYSAPVNISFGFDNRTTAIRIPKVTLDQKHQQERLEFRIPAANADIYLCMLCMLIATEYGIKNQLDCLEFNLTKEGIYGNAFNPQYLLQDLIPNFDTARDHFIKYDNHLKQKLLELLSLKTI